MFAESTCSWTAVWSALFNGVTSALMGWGTAFRARTINETAWLGLGLIACLLIAAADSVISGGERVLTGLLVVPPLLMCARTGARAAATVAGSAVLLAFALGSPDGDFGSVDHALRVLVVMSGGALAVWIAWLRDRAEQAEARSSFVAEAGTRLDRSLDFERTVQTLAKIPVPWLADWCAVYQVAEDGSIRQAAIAHADASKEEIGQEIDRRYPFKIDQSIGIGHVIRTGESELLSDITQNGIESTARDEAHAEMIRRLRLRSAIFVPLRARDRTLGAMAFATAESGRTLGDDDLRLAETLADRAALALDNARLYTQVRKAEAELRESSEEMEAVFQNVASAITVRDPSGMIGYANEAAARLLGFTSVEALLDARAENILARFEVFSEAGELLDVENLPGKVALRGQRPPDAVVRLRDVITGLDRWTVIKATPIFDEDGRTKMVVNIFDDITNQKREELAERFLSDSSRLLVAAIDYESTLDNIARVAVPTIADWCAVDVVDGHGSIENVALAEADLPDLEPEERLQPHYPPPADSSHGVAKVIATGEPELYSELGEDALETVAGSPEHLELLRLISPRSMMIVPMRVRGKVIGAITFCTAESRRRLDERDLDLALELGHRSAMAIENARLYEERSHIARTLQRSLLPPALPHIPGVEVAARFRPAGEGYDVGGDFYDVFKSGNGGWGVVIGDVCGKGPEAAALTGLARHTVRAAAMQESDPSRILNLLSEAILHERPGSEFCTAAYGRLDVDPDGTRMTVASGGHPLPLLVTAEGEVKQVGAPGTLLGFTADTKLVDETLDLRPGATLVFYTDGVTEAGEPRGAFGLGGLKAVLAQCAGMNAQQIAERVDTAAVGLRENPADDIAVLVLRITG
jgi:serine phosphatase RsbU (regulator of sigma subunit)/PAS domain-containing protein